MLDYYRQRAATCERFHAGFRWSHGPRARLASWQHPLHAPLQPGAQWTEHTHDWVLTYTLD